MNNSILRFLFYELVYTAIIVFLGFIIFRFISPGNFDSKILILLPIVFIMTAAMYLSLFQIKKDDMSKFSSRFMMVNGIKMILYLVFIVIFALMYRESAVVFLVSFLALYFLYTGFVLFFLIRRFKKS